MATENGLSFPKSGLMLIGMGPGKISSMTIEAKQAAIAADYRRYEAYTALWPEEEFVKLENEIGTSEKLITFIKDRPGHDFRYALDASKINKGLGWRPSVTFEEGLSKTIDWYLDNKEWLEDITSGKYKNYYKLNYK